MIKSPLMVISTMAAGFVDSAKKYCFVPTVSEEILFVMPAISRQWWRGNSEMMLHDCFTGKIATKKVHTATMTKESQ